VKKAPCSKQQQTLQNFNFLKVPKSHLVSQNTFLENEHEQNDYLFHGISCQEKSVHYHEDSSDLQALLQI